jgi:LCP family protein required for cell wall assembly
MRLKSLGRPRTVGGLNGADGILRSPIVAAALSFVFPGLGQAASGQPRRGAIVAIPTLALLIAMVGVWLFARHDIFNALLSQQWLTAFLAVVLIHLAYRLWAIVDAYVGAGGRISVSRKAGQLGAMAALVVLVAAMAGPHLYVAGVDLTAKSAMNCIFDPNGPECFDYGATDTSSADATADPNATNVPNDDDNPSEAPTETSSATAGPTPTGPPQWQAQYNSITVRSGSGVDQPTIGVLNTGDTVIGVVVTGGSYSNAGTTSADWIHITSGTYAGGYAARLLFSEVVPLAPGQSPTPVPTQEPPVVYPIDKLPPFTGTATDWAADGQLNVLLIGIDAGPGGARYSGLRPDSMILLQVDIATGRAAMYGIPRNLINVPLPPESAQHYACHCYNDLIDYLWNEAANVHPAWYAQYGTGNSDSAKYLRGLGALKGAVSELANLQVDGAVVINLPGFVKLINALTPSGLKIDVPYEVKQDPGFAYSLSGGKRVFNIDIKAGQQVMNGETALAYARLRHVIGYDSDYFRMKRQQLVLRAVRDQVNPCALLPQIQSTLDALSGAIWTDLPRSDTATVAALASKIGTGNTANYSLDPTTTGASSDVLNLTSLAKIHSIVAHGLDGVPAGISGGGGGGGGLSC